MGKDKKKDAPKKEKGKQEGKKDKNKKIIVIKRIVRVREVDVSPETGLETDPYAGVM